MCKLPQDCGTCIINLLPIPTFETKTYKAKYYIIHVAIKSPSNMTETMNIPYRFSAYLLSQEIIQAGDVLTVSSNVILLHL